MRDGFASGGHIAAHFAVLWDARERVRYDLPADDEDAFVALCDFGQEFLTHDRARAVFTEHFHHRAEVHAVFSDAKHACAAHAVQWFEDDVVMLGMKALEAGFVAGDQRRRGELGKF